MLFKVMNERNILKTDVILIQLTLTLFNGRRQFLLTRSFSFQIKAIPTKNSNIKIKPHLSEHATILFIHLIIQIFIQKEIS